MASGVIVSITYIMATGLTALAFILERRDGLFERSLVAGVDTLQVLVAHALTQIIVMVVQIFFVLVFTFLVFEIPSRGPFIWVVLLLLLQGCTGMAFGKFDWNPLIGLLDSKSKFNKIKTTSNQPFPFRSRCVRLLS